MSIEEIKKDILGDSFPYSGHRKDLIALARSHKSLLKMLKLIQRLDPYVIGDREDLEAAIAEAEGRE